MLSVNMLAPVARPTCLLAADIGGSNARLLLAHTTGPASDWTCLRQATYPSPDFAGIEPLLEGFLEGAPSPELACLAIAGPVAGHRARMTNLPWVLDATQLGLRLRIGQVHLINDFAAQAMGLPALDAAGRHTLQAGRPTSDGACALIGAGTGLGVALLAHLDGEPVPLPSEGGHAGFAPRNAEELALAAYLLPRHGRISQELLLSGHGLERLHAYLAGLPVQAEAPLCAARISQAALAGEPLAARAAALFARLLASAAGDLALTGFACGGVFLSGGIAPRLLPFFQSPDVLAAFSDKPPMRHWLARVPLHVVTHPSLGLLGAARMAARLAAAQDG